MSTYRLIKKPMTLTEVFGRGWDIFIATFWKVLPFSFILSVLTIPSHVAQRTPVQRSGLVQDTTIAGKNIASNASDTLSAASNQLSAQTSDMSTGALVVIGILVFIAILVGALIFFGMYAALIKQLDSTVKGNSLNFINALFAGFSKSLTLLGVSIIGWIALAIGLLLLILPGIYIGVALFFATFLPIVNNLGVVDSLKESMHLVSGRWWRTFFSLLITAIIAVLFQFLMGILAGLVLSALHIEFYRSSAILLIVMVITQTVILPLMYSFYLSILYDLQSRKESELTTVSDKNKIQTI